MRAKKQRKRGQKAGPAAGDPAQAVRQALPRITQALIAQAEEGSYQHARFLFEFAGFTGFPRAEGEGEPSLAALLLRELQLEEE